MHKYTIQNFDLPVWSTRIAGIVIVFLFYINNFLLSLGIEWRITLNTLTVIFIAGTIYYSLISWLFFEKILKINLIADRLKLANLNGKWKVIGKGINIVTKEEFDWKGVITIEQTIHKINIYLNTDTSTSTSKSCSAEVDFKDGEYILSYKYDNTPNNNTPDEMRKHNGNCTIYFSKDLKIGRANYNNFSTDRKTNGEMFLTKI
ncbi:MAG: hypothetical protein ACRDAS_10000 [Cetobacterium sp.]